MAYGADAFMDQVPSYVSGLPAFPLSVFGSVLDIAADRTYELVLWVCFADLRMIPVAIPLIIMGSSSREFGR